MLPSLPASSYLSRWTQAKTFRREGEAPGKEEEESSRTGQEKSKQHQPELLVSLSFDEESSDVARPPPPAPDPFQTYRHQFEDFITGASPSKAAASSASNVATGPVGTDEGERVQSVTSATELTGAAALEEELKKEEGYRAGMIEESKPLAPVGKSKGVASVTDLARSAGIYVVRASSSLAKAVSGAVDKSISDISKAIGIGFNAEETQILGEIHKLLQHVYSDLPPEERPSSFSLIRQLITYSVLQEMVTRPPKVTKIEDIADFLSRHPRIVEAQIYSRFATASYGGMMLSMGGGETVYSSAALFHSPEVVVMKTLRIEREDIISADWKGSLHNPSYFLVVDHISRSIVLTIRGTLSLNDVITDLNYTPFDASGFLIGDTPTPVIDFLDAEGCSAPETKRQTVHLGIYKAAVNLDLSLRSLLLETVERYPTYKLRTVGHSLGAGVAAVLTMLWRNVFKDILHCFAFAVPPVMTWELCEALKPYITTVIVGDDIVPRLSHESIMNLKHPIALFIKEKEIAARIIAISKKRAKGSRGPPKLYQMEEEDRIFIESVTHRLQKAMGNVTYYPPGEVYWVTDGLLSSPSLQDEAKDDSGREGQEERKRVLVNAPRSLFKNIHFAATMLRHHMPGACEQELLQFLPATLDPHAISVVDQA